MASFTCPPLQQSRLQLLSFAHCNYSSALITFLNVSTTKHAFNQRFSPFLQVNAHVAPLEAKLPRNTHHNVSRNNHKAIGQNGSGVSSDSLRDRRIGESFQKSSHFDAAVADNVEKRVILKDRHAKTRLNPKSRTVTSPQFSSTRSKDGNTGKDVKKAQGNGKGTSKKERKPENEDQINQLEVERVGKASKKSKADTPGTVLRVGLDMCSKRGDVIGAIRLYDLARKEGINLGQYHYAVLLYLCSSAATGVVQPAKSGSGNRSLNPLGLSKEINSENKEGLDFNGFPAKVNNPVSFSNDSKLPYPQSLDEMVQFMKSDTEHANTDVMGEEGSGIQVTLDVKRYALKRGFEIYNNMLFDKVPMNEATFTSVARIAMSLGDGDLAFDIVKQMKELGINPRLRSYGPALSVFCNNGNVEKAFMVEEHMLQNGVCPEEPELEALLRVSVETGKSDRVYYLLHKLRTSVRQVSSSTADLIEKWFRSKVASRVGKRKLGQRLIKKAMENGGGGWHGLGWLGKGRWTVSRTSVGSDGLCRCCGEKLVTIDLDPAETEHFARSVTSLAIQRDKNSNFEKFQKWLDYYGPFEAVVDGANIGLYTQRKFKPSKVNAVVNGLRQMLPSKKWPLIVLHNRRLTGDKMNEPVNRALIEKWKNADALYATPTGSNDDWYWLYAAIKFKCLIVTNDEMRDHLFQLLGNDFFPKWKERHQVHFSFSETGPVFHMPPPCSIVIQESEKGHWHIPVVSEIETHGEGTWLCVTRSHPLKRGLDSSNVDKELHLPHGKGNQRSVGSQKRRQLKLEPTGHSSHDGSKQAPQKTYQNLKNILSSSLLADYRSITPQLEAAENCGGCIIDFQI
ncbi:uncharacterized protein LOC113774829 [Coffea eugenioides]|uniref:uncharacterized protein LOC113774829 n=1 Tax=Coffea eugenioides TaxID=49369 RepID=UPI000F615293|nr:uncharacterized protein LOC113774829 [Coffea eugenioides]